MLITQAPKGTQDVLPQDSARWQDVEAKMRQICALAGFREVRTPVFEHTELFLRSVGDTTDVVQKEMYTFLDKGGRSVTLKPEGTAGVARAFLEAHLEAGALPMKMYYVSCPVFRYEKPQSGRLREHHQLGIEVFGAKDASCDAEGIRLALDVLEACGIRGLKVAINSIGCPDCRAAYQEKLKEFLRPKLPKLCDTCRDRFERNPMRILDCKVPSCQQELTGAPEMLGSLDQDCQAHFEQLKSCLTALGVEFSVDPRIVRGLDYYTRTVFEIITETENGPLTVCGGGRYDGLVKQLGGPELPGFGFGMGVERVLMVQDMTGAVIQEKPVVDAFVATLGDARAEAMKLVRELRVMGVRADMDHAARSLKAQFKYADKLGAPYLAIVGGDELARGNVKLRDMTHSIETEIPLSGIAEAVKEKIAKEGAGV
jgi:histidyl-tRNA synthetase